MSGKYKKLLEDAMLAQELFDIDELEEFSPIIHIHIKDEE